MSEPGHCTRPISCHVRASTNSGACDEAVRPQAAMMPHPEGLRVTPEMARQQMDALKRMQPDQLEGLAAMAERGGPPDAQRAAEMLKASTLAPVSEPDIMCRVAQVTPTARTQHALRRLVVGDRSMSNTGAAIL